MGRNRLPWLWLLAPLLVAALTLALSSPWASADGYGYAPTPGTGSNATSATVVSGQSYQAATSDTVLRFLTDAGTATASLPTASYIGEQHTGCWLSWSASLVPPVVNAAPTDGGALMVPFAGQASSAPGGLTTWTTIVTPGACGTWKWDGTEWVMP